MDGWINGYWIVCEETDIGKCFYFIFIIFKFFFYFPTPPGCGILVPQPGIEPMPPALEVLSLNHWTSREVSGKC